MPSFVPKKNFPAEIFILKVRIFVENVKNGVQRSSNISRTVNATKNLIRYSESAENSLSPMLHQILPSSMSSGSNFNLKMANFDPKNMHFFAVFEISSQTTGQIRPKFGTMIVLKYTKTLQKTALSYLS